MGTFRYWRKVFYLGSFYVELYSNMNGGPVGVEISAYRSYLHKFTLAFHLFIFRFSVSVDW